MMVKRHYIQTKALEEFEKHLREDEKSQATIEKYMRDVGVFAAFCKGQAVTKELVLAYKARLMNGGGYAVGSINSMLSSVNSFLRFAGWDECRVKAIRTQRRIYCAPEKELTRQEYEKLLRAAKAMGNERLELLVQTICATGIRVSEVRAITAESLQRKQGGSFYTQDNSNAILVGDDTEFAGKIHIACTESSKCVIGRDCLLSSEIVIRSGDSHSIFDESGVRINPAKDVTIGDHVWVGYRALVTKGAMIPNNCVVGTGAVVTRKTEKGNVVLAGVPAKTVKEGIDWCRERI